MNALTKLRKTEAAPVPATSPEDIRRRIAELQAQAIKLDKDQLELAEASIKDPAAEVAYHQNIADGAATQGEIERLTAALASMNRKATEATTAAQSATAASHRARVVQLLDERVEVARTFETTLAATVAAFHSLLEISETTYLAWPGTQPDIMSTALSRTMLTQLVGAEMFRQGGQPTLTGGYVDGRQIPALPGPKCPGFEFTDRPHAVPSLVAAITDANTLARRELEGKQ